jgi:hypothetical protein
MKVIDFVQNMVENTLRESEVMDNIYTSPRRNSEYPYCIISVDKIDDSSNVGETIFTCHTSLNIYDRSSDSGNIVNLSEGIRNSLRGIAGNQNDVFLLKNIIFRRSSVKLFNEVNPVWNINIEFEILVKQL